jgi:hypothetical protein
LLSIVHIRAFKRSTSDAMLNVMDFRRRAYRSNESRTPRPAANADVDISELVSSVRNLQSKAKGQIQQAVLMLDHAAQKAHRVAEWIWDPQAKKDFEEKLAAIEQLLQTARDLALKL